VPSLFLPGLFLTTLFPAPPAQNSAAFFVSVALFAARPDTQLSSSAIGVGLSFNLVPVGTRCGPTSFSRWGSGPFGSAGCPRTNSPVALTVGSALAPYHGRAPSGPPGGYPTVSPPAPHPLYGLGPDSCRYGFSAQAPTPLPGSTHHTDGSGPPPPLPRSQPSRPLAPGVRLRPPPGLTPTVPLPSGTHYQRDADSPSDSSLLHLQRTPLPLTGLSLPGQHPYPTYSPFSDFSRPYLSPSFRFSYLGHSRTLGIAAPPPPPPSGRIELSSSHPIPGLLSRTPSLPAATPPLRHPISPVLLGSLPYALCSPGAAFTFLRMSLAAPSSPPPPPRHRPRTYASSSTRHPYSFTPVPAFLPRRLSRPTDPGTATSRSLGGRAYSPFTRLVGWLSILPPTRLPILGPSSGVGSCPPRSRDPPRILPALSPDSPPTNLTSIITALSSSGSPPPRRRVRLLGLRPPLLSLPPRRRRLPLAQPRGHLGLPSFSHPATLPPPPTCRPLRPGPPLISRHHLAPRARPRLLSGAPSPGYYPLHTSRSAHPLLRTFGGVPRLPSAGPAGGRPVLPPAFPPSVPARLPPLRRPGTPYASPPPSPGARGCSTGVRLSPGPGTPHPHRRSPHAFPSPDTSSPGLTSRAVPAAGPPAVSARIGRPAAPGPSRAPLGIRPDFGLPPACPPAFRLTPHGPPPHSSISGPGSLLTPRPRPLGCSHVRITATPPTRSTTATRSLAISSFSD
jgi:hypothetical protein